MRKLLPPLILIGAILLLFRGAFLNAPAWARAHSGIALFSLAVAIAITVAALLHKPGWYPERLCRDGERLSIMGRQRDTGPCCWG